MKHITDNGYKLKIQGEPKQKLDCPFDFTSRCTIGRCDCKPKQETLKEGLYRIREQCPIWIDDFSFEQGAKWQQKRGYNEEEVENLIIKIIDNFCTFFSDELKKKVAKEQFEQFKKK